MKSGSIEGQSGGTIEFADFQFQRLDIYIHYRSSPLLFLKSENIHMLDGAWLI